VLWEYAARAGPCRGVVAQNAVQEIPPLVFPAILQQKQAEAITRLYLVGRGLDGAEQLIDPAFQDFQSTELAVHPPGLLGIAAGLQATEEKAMRLQIARIRNDGAPEIRFRRSGPPFPNCESAPLH
jgi:hypothetical protein